MVGQIITGLLVFPGAAVLAAAVYRLRTAYRCGPEHVRFHVGPDEVLWLACTGRCVHVAMTRHEPAGDGTATCWDCGTQRAIPPHPQEVA